MRLVVLGRRAASWTEQSALSSATAPLQRAWLFYLPCRGGDFLPDWQVKRTDWWKASSFHGFRGSSRDIIVDVLCSLLASDSAHLLLRDTDTNGMRTWLRLLISMAWMPRDSCAPVLLLLVFAFGGQPHRRLDHSPHRHRRGQEDRDDERKDPIYSYLWITCARSKTWTFG
jgi:hypothetical protein